jgi:hypothetical protein
VDNIFHEFNFLSVVLVTNVDEGSKLNDRIKLENLLRLILFCRISVLSSRLITVCITVYAYSLVSLLIEKVQ